MAGTVTAGLLLDKFTLTPLLGAVAVSDTVQVSVPVPVKDASPQESEFSDAGTVVPVPLREIISLLAAEELLETVNCPVA